MKRLLFTRFCTFSCKRYNILIFSYFYQKTIIHSFLHIFMQKIKFTHCFIFLSKGYKFNICIFFIIFIFSNMFILIKIIKQLYFGEILFHNHDFAVGMMVYVLSYKHPRYILVFLSLVHASIFIKTNLCYIFDKRTFEPRSLSLLAHKNKVTRHNSYSV